MHAPQGVAFVSASSSQGTASQNGGVITANLGYLGNGASATVTIVVSITSPGAVLDSATVNADPDDPNTDNNRADVAATATLAAPAALSATSDGSAIDLQWSAVAGAVTYNVYRSTSSGAETLETPGVSASNAAVVAFRDNSVVAGQTYDYEVTAVAGAFESPRSNEASAAVPAIPPIQPPPPIISPTQPPPTTTPQPPVGPIRVYASLLDTGGGTFAPFITWGDPSAIATTRFRVYRTSGSGVEVEITDPSGILAHDLIDRTARAGSTYTYRVTATTLGVESPRSAPAIVAVPLVGQSPLKKTKKLSRPHLVSPASSIPRGPLHGPSRIRHRSSHHHAGRPK